MAPKKRPHAALPSKGPSNGPTAKKSRTEKNRKKFVRSPGPPGPPPPVFAFPAEILGMVFALLDRNDLINLLQVIKLLRVHNQKTILREANRLLWREISIDFQAENLPIQLPSFDQVEDEDCLWNKIRILNLRVKIPKTELLQLYDLVNDPVVQTMDLIPNDQLQVLRFAPLSKMTRNLASELLGLLLRQTKLVKVNLPAITHDSAKLSYNFCAPCEGVLAYRLELGGIDTHPNLSEFFATRDHQHTIAKTLFPGSWHSVHAVHIWYLRKKGRALFNGHYLENVVSCRPGELRGLRSLHFANIRFTIHNSRVQYFDDHIGLEEFKQVNSIQVMDCERTDKFLENVVGVLRLKSLALHWSELELQKSHLEKIDEVLNSFSGLRELAITEHIPGPTLSDPETIRSILKSHGKTLQKLSLSVEFSSQVIDVIAETCPALTHLTINARRAVYHVNHGEKGWKEKIDVVAQQLYRLPKVRHINVAFQDEFEFSPDHLRNLDPEYSRLAERIARSFYRNDYKPTQLSLTRFPDLGGSQQDRTRTFDINESGRIFLRSGVKYDWSDYGGDRWYGDSVQRNVGTDSLKRRWYDLYNGDKP